MFRKEFLQAAGTLVAGGWVANSPLSSINKEVEPVKPPALKPGDTIGFISPAGILFDEREFDRMQDVMESMGFRVRFGEHVKKRFGYLAGTDEERASDFNRFFADPEINGIVAVRGGWGCNRILPLIDFESIGNNPKFFCGFSDITSLHLSINHKTGLTTFHGPNGVSDWTIFTRNHFRKIAFGDGENLTLKNPAKEITSVQTINSGKARGKLLGGNLTLVTSLLGSHYHPDYKGAILFLEDIGEDVYRIDRMMSQLNLSGILNNLSGFIFGRCTNCRESVPVSLTLKEVLDGYLKPIGIPAFSGSMISHEPNNFTLPVGIEAELDADEGKIQLLENSVV